jgi:hypothetical protein
MKRIIIFLGTTFCQNVEKNGGGGKGGIWCQNILIFSKKTWPNFEKVF